MAPRRSRHLAGRPHRGLAAVTRSCRLLTRLRTRTDEGENGEEGSGGEAYELLRWTNLVGPGLPTVDRRDRLPVARLGLVSHAVRAQLSISHGAAAQAWKVTTVCCTVGVCTLVPSIVSVYRVSVSLERLAQCAIVIGYSLATGP